MAKIQMALKTDGFGALIEQIFFACLADQGQTFNFTTCFTS